MARRTSSHSSGIQDPRWTNFLHTIRLVRTQIKRSQGRSGDFGNHSRYVPISQDPRTDEDRSSVDSYLIASTTTGTLVGRGKSLLNRTLNTLSLILRKQPLLYFGTNTFCLLTIAEILLLMIFIIIHIFMIQSAITSYDKGGNVREDPGAATIGSLADICLVFAVICGNHNFPRLFSSAYCNLLKYHILFAYWGIFLVLVHTVAFIPLWIREDIMWSYSFEWIVLSGYISIVAGIVVVMTSIKFIREYFYQIFYRSHLLFVAMFFLFGALHGSSGLAVGLAWWLIDLCIRYRNVHSFPAELLNSKILPADIIELEFTKKDFDYKPGQFVLVCVPEISRMEWHPFSISSCPTDMSQTFHVRPFNRWTRKLYDAVRETDSDESGVVLDQKALSILVEGPYGAIGFSLDDYEDIVLISGGIGVTPMQSLFNTIFLEHQHNRRRLHRMHFVWVVRDPQLLPLDPFREENLLGYSEALPNYYIPDLLLHHSFGEMSDSSSARVITDFYLTHPQNGEELRQRFSHLRFGRPDIVLILRQAALACGPRRRVAVLCSGPQSMMNDVQIFAAKQSQKSGVKFDCHAELFEL